MRRFLSVLAAAVFLPAAVDAQPAAVTLPEAVKMATDTYPSIRASLEQVSAAAAGINLARTSYLPRADVLAQANRATRNNVFGLLLPQAVIPSISGPVLGTNNFTNVWSSATGFLISWEPFDFGARKAGVESAESSVHRAEASAVRTRLEVGTATADAFLTVLAAEQTIRSAKAAAERVRAVRGVVEASVRTDLRPGADLERIRAEGAVADAQIVEAEQSAAVARATLAQLLGLTASSLEVKPGPLFDLPPEGAPPGGAASEHPSAMEQHAAVGEAEARQKVLSRSFFPRFTLQAGAYSRGSGAHLDGTTGGAFSGLAPDTVNWALGMTVTLPLGELPALRTRREIELHRHRAEVARYEQVLQELSGRRGRASAQIEGARRLAAVTPVRLEASRALREQSLARYKAGLGTMIEVADAERQLTQAEIDDGLARLGVWRAKLALAAAAGDLAPFIAQAGR